MTSGSKSSQNFRLSDIVGQTAAGVFASKGYIIQSGFLNSSAGQELSFTVSPSTADFGVLVPHQPIVTTLFITIANGDMPGYIVKASENQPLSTLAGATIVDTRCDAQPTPCTQTQPAIWNKNVTYGFGYRMDGKTAPQLFDSKDVFAPFPATLRNEQPTTVLQSAARRVKDQATMSLKVNVEPNQPVGQYRNVISFIALPGI